MNYPRKAFLTSVLFFAVYSFSICQSWEYGLGVKSTKLGGHILNEDPFNRVRYSVSEVEVEHLFFELILGLNFPLYSPTKEFTIGVQGSPEIGVMFAESGTGGGLQMPGIALFLPGYLTLRFGAGSNRNSKANFGVGVGVGYKYSIYLSDSDNGNPDNASTISFVKPSLLMEISHDKGRSGSFLDNSKLRFEMSLGSYEQNKYFAEYDLEYGYTIKEASISYIKFLDFK